MLLKFFDRMKFLLIFILLLFLTTAAWADSHDISTAEELLNWQNDYNTEDNVVLNITADITLPANTLLSIGKNVTINGNGYTLTGCGNLSVIQVIGNSFPTVFINDLTIKGGSNNGGGGGINAEGGNLTVTNCRFESNEATSGGAIFHNGNWNDSGSLVRNYKIITWLKIPFHIKSIRDKFLASL